MRAEISVLVLRHFKKILVYHLWDRYRNKTTTLGENPPINFTFPKPSLWNRHGLIVLFSVSVCLDRDQKFELNNNLEGF